MSTTEIPQKLLLQMDRDRRLIAEELPELTLRDARMQKPPPRIPCADTCGVPYIAAAVRYEISPMTPASARSFWLISWKASAPSLGRARPFGSAAGVAISLNA